MQNKKSTNEFQFMAYLMFLKYNIASILSQWLIRIFLFFKCTYVYSAFSPYLSNIKITILVLFGPHKVTVVT